MINDIIYELFNISYIFNIYDHTYLLNINSIDKCMVNDIIMVVFKFTINMDH